MKGLQKVWLLTITTLKSFYYILSLLKLISLSNGYHKSCIYFIKTMDRSIFVQLHTQQMSFDHNCHKCRFRSSQCNIHKIMTLKFSYNILSQLKVISHSNGYHKSEMDAVSGCTIGHMPYANQYMLISFYLCGNVNRAGGGGWARWTFYKNNGSANLCLTAHTVDVV